MHSVEGGVVFSQNEDIIQRMAYLRNFGHAGFEKFNGIGINAKNSEFHAAMGLCVLEDIELILAKRKEQSLRYDEFLSALPVTKPGIQVDCSFNFAYYPILFESEAIALKVKAALEAENIFPRRYFYPSLSSLDYVIQSSTPISDDCASRILCLPLYFELKDTNQNEIVKIIRM